MVKESLEKQAQSKSVPRGARGVGPDIVPLDVKVLGVGGCQVARRARAARNMQGTRVIALTGRGQPCG
jgi:DNA-binding response OmpR family regulator